MARVTMSDDVGSISKQNSAIYYWIPAEIHTDHDYADHRPQDYVEHGAVKFAGSDAESQAKAWFALQQKVAVKNVDMTGDTDWIISTLDYDDELEDSSLYLDDETALETAIPLAVAREGKAAIAAYLWSHAIHKNTIARVLDVSESTVEQYISDFKKGRR